MEFGKKNKEDVSDVHLMLVNLIEEARTCFQLYMHMYMCTRGLGIKEKNAQEIELPQFITLLYFSSEECVR